MYYLSTLVTLLLSMSLFAAGPEKELQARLACPLWEGKESKKVLYLYYNFDEHREGNFKNTYAHVITSYAPGGEHGTKETLFTNINYSSVGEGDKRVQQLSFWYGPITTLKIYEAHGEGHLKYYRAELFQGPVGDQIKTADISCRD